jgi:hypothetical protein
MSDTFEQIVFFDKCFGENKNGDKLKGAGNSADPCG